MKVIQRTAAVPAGPAAAVTNANERPNALRLALRAQPRSGALQRAFTSAELLIVIVTAAVCFLGLALLLPRMAKAKARGGPSCQSYQRQVALAFRMWANDHQEKFPMQVAVAQGGTYGLSTDREPLATFMSLSNEMITPAALKCPADPARTRIRDFAGLTRINVSYFISLYASITNPSPILIGDRNLFINGRQAKKIIEVTNPAALTWGAQVHVNYGNVAFADGSVMRVFDPSLQKSLQDSGLVTNRFAIPWLCIHDSQNVESRPSLWLNSSSSSAQCLYCS